MFKNLFGCYLSTLFGIAAGVVIFFAMVFISSQVTWSMIESILKVLIITVCFYSVLFVVISYLHDRTHIQKAQNDSDG